MMTENPIETKTATSYHLRIEAGPHEYQRLFASEKAAIDAVIDLLQEAIGLVSAPDDRRGHQRGRAGYVIEDVRASRIAFLSGRRGSGKSTVLLSLMHMLDSRRLPPDVQLAPKVGDLRSRIVLLEPLDMEPLARGANLLAGILQRIEVAVMAAVHQARSVDRTRPSDPPVSVLQGLRALQQDVGIAWDGNLLQRSGALDPDAYAHDVVRAEHARLATNARLADALDELARSLAETREYDNPIFLLPVDDFDLSPERCLELLHLLRMVSVPRLFAVICGDIELARSIIQMKNCGDMNRLIDERMHGDGNEPTVAPQEIRALANQLTTNALRKLLPPGQRIELEPLTISEALDQIQSRTQHSLRSILKGIRVGLAGDRRGVPADLAEMLGDEIYTARQVLAMYPRHATDLMHLAQRNQNQTALDLVHEAAQMALAEDGVTKGREAITRTDSGGHTLLSRYFAASAQTGRGRQLFDPDAAEDPTGGRALMLYEHREWQVYAEPRGAGRIRVDRSTPPLPESAALWIVLYHDLCQLSGSGRVVGEPLVPKQLTLITTGWADGIRVPWPHPRWSTFYEADRFIARVSQMLADAPVALAPLAWIRAVLGSDENGKGTRNGDRRQRFPSGDELAKWCHEGPEHTRAWIEHLPVWLAPECGVPPTFASELLRNKSLVGIWERRAPRIRELRGDNLDQYVELPEVVHRLGGRPQEIYDILRNAKRVLDGTKARLPAEIVRAADLARIRIAVARLGTKRLRPRMAPLPAILQRLRELELNEEAAVRHPINAFRDGIFRPTPADNLVTDYEPTFYKQDEEKEESDNEDKDDD